MSKNEQHHKGSGDNVLGDKIVNIFFPKKLIFLSIMFGIVLLGYGNRGVVKRALGFEKVFSRFERSFKILVLPFKIMCKDIPNKDIGQVINDRLNDLAINDSLRINAHYLDINIGNNFNYDSANYLLKYHNADQIVYGNFFDDSCTDIDGDEICYNWISNERWKSAPKDKNVLINSNYQSANLKDIRSGKIQGNTDLIAFWAIGLSAMKRKDYDEAIKRFEKVLSLNDSLYQAIYLKGISFYHLSEFATALDNLNKVITYESNHYAANYFIARILDQINSEEADEQWEKFYNIYTRFTENAHPKNDSLSRLVSGLFINHNKILREPELQRLFDIKNPQYKINWEESQNRNDRSILYKQLKMMEKK